MDEDAKIGRFCIFRYGVPRNFQKDSQKPSAQTFNSG